MENYKVFGCKVRTCRFSDCCRPLSLSFSRIAHVRLKNIVLEDHLPKRGIVVCVSMVMPIVRLKETLVENESENFTFISLFCFVNHEPTYLAVEKALVR